MSKETFPALQDKLDKENIKASLPDIDGTSLSHTDSGFCSLLK